MMSARSLDGRGYRANRSFDDMQNEDEAAPTKRHHLRNDKEVLNCSGSLF
jgi:hypothetical protein